MALDEADPTAARREYLSLLAQSPADKLATLWSQAGLSAEYSILRAPEVGAVMVRGRAGAIGAPFNLGEMTVTRASVQLDNDVVGHGYVQGRNRDQALQAALVDGMMQTRDAASVEAAILAPLRMDQARRKATRAAKADATKVNFFTMVRGED